jgi:hypothetical protein
MEDGLSDVMQPIDEENVDGHIEEDLEDIEPEEEELDQFAVARSHEASKFAYDSCKVIAQSCLLINGGAATAVIALLSKDRVDQSLITWVPWGLAGYGLGVVFSAVMLFCVMMMADNWNYAWYWRSHGGDEELGEKCEIAAGWWQKGVFMFFIAPIICFTMGSGIIAYGLAHAAPTQRSSFPSVIYLPTPPKG